MASFGLYIVASIAAIRGVNVPMYTTLRRTAVVFTMAAESALAGQRYSKRVCAASVPRAVLTLACAAAAALAIASTPVHADVCEDVDGWVDEYGYDCAYWGKDMNGDGLPDCHLSETYNLHDIMDNLDITREYYFNIDYWQDDIRTNCPKACGVCMEAEQAAEDDSSSPTEDAPPGDSCDCNKKKKKTCKPLPCKKKKAKALAKACKKTLKSKKCKKAIKKAPECLYEYLA